MTSPVTCIAVGDPHFMTSNVLDAEILIEKLNTLVDQLCPDFIVLLGDTLHTHEKIHVTPYGLATQLITSLAEKLPVFVLIGNHDYCNNQQFLTDAHAFNPFKKIANVTICDKPIIRKLNGLKFVFCPYVPPERFEEALSTLEQRGKKWDDAECIFAHQEFYGCRFNPLATSTEGDIWPEDFPLVVSGHIHNEQRLQSNIYYPGSSMQHAFGETANKIIAHLKFQKDQPFVLQRIDLEMKKKKIVYISAEKAANFMPNPNVYTKLVIKDTPDQFQVFRKSAKYKELSKMGLAISFAPVQPVSVLSTGRNIENKGVLDILQELIKDENEYVHNAFNELKI